MEVFAKGKNIPTYAFGNLFTQGERFADTITLTVDRYYNDIDLNECKFMIVGITEDGWEISQVLTAGSTEEKYTRLEWKVSGDFTVNAGKLCLELRAFKEKDGEINTVIKYNMSPVYVKSTISGKNEPPPDTAEQFINSMSVLTAECMEKLQKKMDDFNLEQTENRMNQMEKNIAVYLERPEVIPVYKVEYDSIQHRKNALYVIIGEE